MQEIVRDLARRYAECVWRRGVAGAVGLFVEDGVMDTGSDDDVYVRTAGGWKFQARKLNMRFFAPLLEGWGEASLRDRKID